MINKVFNLFKKYAVFIFFLIFLLATNYYLLNNKFFRVHDYTHATRIAEMGRALKDGAFPVRWSENFGFGFGMPLFNFYAPLPYFIGALFWLIGIDVVVAIKLLYFLSSFLAMLGAFKLGKKLFGTWGGLLLAAAYVLAPYRAVNLFVRGALSEAWAMAFLPWVLYSSFTWIDDKKNKNLLAILVLSLVGIVLSHNLTAMIFIPLSGLISFIYFLFKSNWSLKKTLKNILPIFLIYLLAGALTTFYMLPAYTEKGFTIIEDIFSGYFHYSYHFLYIRQFFKTNWKYGGSIWGPEDDISFFLGYGQLLALAVLAIVALVYFFKNFKKIKTNKFLIILFIFSFSLAINLFMSIMKSKFLWDNISLLTFIQFPWRFLAPATLMLAVLVALSAAMIKSKIIRSIYSVFVIIVILFNAQFFHAEKFMDNPYDLYFTNEDMIRSEMSGILPDYIPIQMTDEILLKDLNKNTELVWEEKNQGLVESWETLVDKGHQKLFSLKTNEETLINFKLANFPGWEAQIDGESVEIKVNEEIGNIQLLVPAGEHQISLRFTENTKYRIIGDSISFIALLVFFYIFSPFDKKQKKD
jgi:hypothetical protein